MKIKLEIGETYEMSQEEALIFFDADPDSLELLESGKGYRGIIHCLSADVIQSAIIESNFNIANIDSWVEDNIKDCSHIIEINKINKEKEENEEVKVRIKLSNLSLENEDWTIDEEATQSIEDAMDWIRENLKDRNEIDGFKITEKNFKCVGFDNNGQCTIITTEDPERCIYLQS